MPLSIRANIKSTRKINIVPCVHICLKCKCQYLRLRDYDYAEYSEVHYHCTAEYHYQEIAKWRTGDIWETDMRITVPEECPYRLEHTISEINQYS